MARRALHVAPTVEAPVDPLTLAIRAAVRVELVPVLEALSAGSTPSRDYTDRRAEAERLGVSLATLDRLAHEGMPYVIVGDVRRYRPADVDAWLAARTKERRG